MTGSVKLEAAPNGEDSTAPSDDTAAGMEPGTWGDRSRSGSLEENRMNDDDDALQLAERDSLKQEDGDEDDDDDDDVEEGCHALDDRPLMEQPGTSHDHDNSKSSVPDTQATSSGSNKRKRSSLGRDNETVTAISVEELLKPDIRPDGTMVASARTLESRLSELPPGVGYGKRKTVIRIGDEEAAFVLGRQGRTKAKIGRVSGCRVNLTNNLDLELIGSAEARSRAELYVKLVVQQRRGPVIIDFDHTDRNDLTIVDVPTNCVAFVTGQQGHVLRSIEEEWATLMFFVRHVKDLDKKSTTTSTAASTAAQSTEDVNIVKGEETRSGGEDDEVEENENGDENEADNQTTKIPDKDDNDYSVPPKEGEPERPPCVNDSGTSEKLLIFGDERGRRGAELKVMSAVEQKNPRRFSSLFTPEYVSDKPGFDTDRTLIGKEDFSYALGKDGGTRRKLAKASHCILEYIGRIAFIAGTMEERRRCREYLGWLIEQRTTAIHVDTTGRTDVTSIVVPKNLIQSIAGPRGTTLRKLEGISQTFCFIDAETPNPNEERLLIFSHSVKARETARQVLYDQMDRFCARRALTREKAAPKSEYVYQDPTERSARATAVYSGPPMHPEWMAMDEPFDRQRQMTALGSAQRRPRRSRAERKRAQKTGSLDGPLQPPRSLDSGRNLDPYPRSPGVPLMRHMMLQRDPRIDSPHAGKPLYEPRYDSRLAEDAMEGDRFGWRHNGGPLNNPPNMRGVDRNPRKHDYPLPQPMYREEVHPGMGGRPLHPLSPTRSPHSGNDMYGPPEMWYPGSQYSRSAPIRRQLPPDQPMRYGDMRRRGSYGEMRPPYRENMIGGYDTVGVNGPPPAKRRMLRHNA